MWTSSPPYRRGLPATVRPHERSQPAESARRRARTATKLSRAIALSVKAASPKPTTVVQSRVQTVRVRSITAVPTIAGGSSRFWSTSPLVARHGSAGAIAMRKSSNSPSGAPRRSK